MSAAVRAGYKQTEVGVIPEEWELISVGKIATIEGGYAFSSKDFLSQGAYQIVKMSNLYGGTLDLDRSTSFLNELDDLQRHYLLNKDDILLTLTGTTGKRDFGFSYRLNEQSNLLLNQRVARLVVRANADAGYLAYQLAAPTFQNQFFDISKGGTGNQTNVGTSDVAAMFFPYPPLPEQRAIATALSDVDELLAKLDALIAKKRDLKVATMQQLLTGQTRLPGFSGEWEVKRLGDVASMGSGGTPPSSVSAYYDGDYSWVSIADMTKGGKTITKTDKSLSSAGLANSAAQMFPAGTILYAMYASLGECSIAGMPLCTSQAILGIRPHEALSSEFLYYYLASLKNVVKSMGQQGTQANLNKGMVQAFELNLPQIQEQTAIATILSDMDTELTALEARRDKTRALKKGMMQELLTGRIRLI